MLLLYWIEIGSWGHFKRRSYFQPLNSQPANQLSACYFPKAVLTNLKSESFFEQHPLRRKKGGRSLAEKDWGHFCLWTLLLTADQKCLITFNVWTLTTCCGHKPSQALIVHHCRKNSKHWRLCILLLSSATRLLPTAAPWHSPLDILSSWHLGEQEELVEEHR